MFIDTATIKIKAGDGGRGAVSFRTEKYIDRGGPDGGDGGRGGHVIFRAAHDADTLANFRNQKELKAENGEPGFKRRMHGKNGKDLEVIVPIGTVITIDGETVCDMIEDGQQAVIAKGGDGGFGNAHFKSSTRQAPRIAEVGEPGDELEVTLELKLLADVGLVGFPNAGKSTFLSVVSNAKPEIADYPFTTLTPNLGVADIDGHSLLIADIPGLIEGASEGKGLGDEFLRHIERTSVLLHLIDIYEEDAVAAYKTISRELEAHSKQLSKRPRIVVLTKTEGVNEKRLKEVVSSLKKALPKTAKIMGASAAAGIGIKEVLRETWKLVEKSRQKSKEVSEVKPDQTVIELSPEQLIKSWEVKKVDNTFVITGRKIEKFAARTDFESSHGRARLKDIMKKMGIWHELNRKGIQPSNSIAIGAKQRYKVSLQDL